MLFIGAKIQEYRKKQGLSQEEFAAKVGVTRQAVSKWETDRAYPDLDKLVAICDILQISITGLVYGETGLLMGQAAGPAQEGRAAGSASASAGEEPVPKEAFSGEARGAAAPLRLWVLLALVGGMFLFCGALLVTVLTHNAWKKEDALAERVRVERVYQQYTKADVSFFDEVSRRVVKTVWLDVNGIREGDYLVCYTDEEQKSIYYGYRGPTLIVLGVVELVLFIIFLIGLAECRHFAGKNGGPVPAEEPRAKGRPIPEEEAKKKNKPVPAEEVRAKGRPITEEEIKESKRR